LLDIRPVFGRREADERERTGNHDHGHDRKRQ